MAYITITEYNLLGGTVNSQTAFNSLLIETEAKLNHITQGRLDQLYGSLEGELPEEIKILITNIINLLATVDTSRTADQSSYSNGIESISYNTSMDSRAALNIKIMGMCKEYFWRYPNLLYRGNSTDVDYFYSR